jgi:hypothetical protein
MFCSVAFFSRSLCLAALTVVAAAGCNGSKAVLTQQAEAHRLASHLHGQFSRAADASNRAVMADTDEASIAAAHEAEQATLAVENTNIKAQRLSFGPAQDAVNAFRQSIEAAG